MAEARSSHEDYADEEAKPGSNRGFGLVVGGLLALIGGTRGSFRGIDLLEYALVAVGAALILAGLVVPGLLGPFNRTWFRLGLLVSRAVTPLLMGLLFFVVVTPVAMAKKAFGKDTLGLRFDAEIRSYWVERKPPGPAPDTMVHQF